MKKSKKAVCFFGFVLTLAAALCVGVSAGEKTAVCGIPISLESGGGSIVCRFELKAVTENAPMPESNEVTICEGNAVFGDITYDVPGIYRYAVRQVTENVPEGWTIDGRIMDVTVYVTSDENGELTTSCVSSIDGDKTMTFRNTYTENPKTGDAAVIGAAVMLAGVSVITALLLKKKYRMMGEK